MKTDSYEGNEMSEVLQRERQLHVFCAAKRICLPPPEVSCLHDRRKPEFKGINLKIESKCLFEIKKNNWNPGP